jgi:16S rRNA processing protein RimM
VTGAYGVRGWVRVFDSSGALAVCSTWSIGGKRYAVEETKRHSGALLAKLAGIEIREAALKLKGMTVSVERAALPEPPRGTYYHADLIGLEVVNAQGVMLGVVKGLFSNGAQDVAELSGERTRLLPWVSAVVKNVDLAARRIEVEWGADW